MSSTGKIILHGITLEGEKFRPSDWAERLCGAVASYGPNRHSIFHPKVSLAAIDNIKCVVIDSSLEASDEMLFDFLMDFSTENKLQVSHEED